MIEFQNVSKTYDTGTHALNHVNLKIRKGEFVFVVGHSGAGKSTLIKLLLRDVKYLLTVGHWASCFRTLG